MVHPLLKLRQSADVLEVLSNISLIKQQFVVTHAVRQNEIPALLGAWITNKPSAKMFYLQNNLLPLIFSQKYDMLKCWSVKDL
jgi:hypothetical protein